MRTFLLPTSSAIAILSSLAAASYSIQDEYSPSNFANMFDFFTGADPTNGYVNYLSQPAAESSGLYSANSNAVYMGVDANNTATGSGRDSVRIASKNIYNHGLIILDLAHMPAGACGSWPAFWLLGPDWPNNGELDIIEGVNSQTTNAFTAHTGPGCSITSTGAFAGTISTSNCDINAPGQGTNVGCSIKTSNTQTYGAVFNAVGGGIYATEWTSDAISIWFFPRTATPSDISSSTPNPENWGIPMAQFTGSCDIDEHFRDQQIVFDVTFCGQWAGQVWNSESVCSPKAATCQDYVQNNPSAFADTYWLINSLKVYQESGGVPATSSTRVSTASTTAVASTTSTQPTSFTTYTTSPPVSSTTSTTYSPTSYSPSYSTSSFSYTQPSPTSTYTPTYTSTWSGQSWTTQTWSQSWTTPSWTTQTWSPPYPSASQSWTEWPNSNSASGNNANWGGSWGGGGGYGGGWRGPP